ncbi:enoyl-CoA hydratase/isomerase [Hyphomonas sp.]|jgi:2-(1,2-epoxy-1,2-dihydrophenyl)acetyl-CoA isomerase|uniref:enoyl-CoA hydratase/isomerase n=1 Tax=Hyphomonas sp. TaxID=87 RepID=UPI0025BDF2D4|nr:enoyl-CoA hydratase/isomerase [Hyphomonas sp.]MEE2922655.1 enoyl-CoA hydratase/isomerase [Pseudomonadota bacterium]
MAYTKISYELKGDIAIIAFNDPSTLNACGVDTAQELLHAFEVAADEARCTILTGEGRGFCSGANLGPGQLNVKLSHEGSKPDAGRALTTHYNPLMQAIREHPHPVITAVNGPAAGVGCSLALVGDIIVCAKSAYFLQAFRRIGLVPDGGSTWLLARTIGRPRAMEMALFGEKVPAEKALEWGMVNRVVEDDALMSTAMEMAETLATGPTVALSLARDLMWKACESDFDEAIYDERIAQRTAGRTDDFKEGVSAFLQKRKADFKGK